MRFSQAICFAVLALLLAAAAALAWLARDLPLEPGWARGLLRADGLTALLGACTALIGLAEVAGGRSPARAAAAATLLCVGYLSAHLAGLGVALLGAAILLGGRRAVPIGASLAVAVGLALIALQAGTWRYPVPTAGLGLNSLSFALILLGTLAAAGAAALPSTQPGAPPPPAWPLLAAGCLYALLRLFSLGPWNLGWLYAAMLLGGAMALWAAVRAIASHPREWLGRYYLALGVAGAGLASGAGVALAAFALIALAALRLALSEEPPLAPSADGEPPSAESAGRGLLWLLSGALPFTAPFTAAWAAVAGALAGELSLLAVALWAAALLAALALARAAVGPAGSDPPVAGTPWLRLAAGLSLAAGVGAPALVWLLVEPAVAQLQAGLTPFGELALWPWAGLLALDASRQPVATLPSLALAALMLVLGALAWVVSRLLGSWRDQRHG